MSEELYELIADARESIALYTDEFEGDIGQRFKRVDARLERALDALEDEAADIEDVRDHLEDAQQDLNRVVRKCYTGVTPGNLQKYVERPLDRAVDGIE